MEQRISVCTFERKQTDTSLERVVEEEGGSLQFVAC